MSAWIEAEVSLMQIYGRIGAETAKQMVADDETILAQIMDRVWKFRAVTGHRAYVSGLVQGSVGLEDHLRKMRR